MSSDSAPDPSAAQYEYQEASQEAPSVLDQALELPEVGLRVEMSGLLEACVKTYEKELAPKRNLLQTFLTTESKAAALQLWVGDLSKQAKPIDRERLSRLLNRDIGMIDRLLNEQVNAIIHHPKYQGLESAWRGLAMLVEETELAKELAAEKAIGEEEPPEIRIRALNISKKELARDFEKAIEFDQSEMFKKIYESEFGTAGGEPYGALIGDYEFTNHPKDVALLNAMSEVAAAAFAPFVAGAAPQLLGLDDFGHLDSPTNLESTFQQKDYIKWRAMRERDDTRFLGLTLPRVLMRVPYKDDGSQHNPFRFTEDVNGPDRKRYLWGNAAWAFGSVLIRAFGECGWFADIRGFERGYGGGGLVTNLPAHSFETDREGVALKTSTEVVVSEIQEKRLAMLGLIPLLPCKDTEYSMFLSNQSLHQPAKYKDVAADTNSRISAMLQYILCVSRIAHYLKVLARDKIGTFDTEQELERYLQQWLVKYTAVDINANPETRAKYPIRESQVQVKPIPGQPGQYSLTMHLMPHFQLDQLTATLKFLTKFRQPGS